MNTPDPHDIRKAEIEDRAIHAAEDAAQVAAFAKAAYEAWRREAISNGATDRLPMWRELTPKTQCTYVAIAQAVLKEAQRVG